jgi:hypothetical protein
MRPLFVSVVVSRSIGDDARPRSRSRPHARGDFSGRAKCSWRDQVLRGLLSIARVRPAWQAVLRPLPDDPVVAVVAVVAAVADRLGRSPAQLLLRWCVQRGIPVITKSTHRDRIAEEAQVFEW